MKEKFPQVFMFCWHSRGERIEGGRVPKIGYTRDGEECFIITNIQYEDLTPEQALIVSEHLQEVIRGSKVVHCQQNETLRDIDTALDVDVLDKLNIKKTVIDVTSRRYDITNQQAIIHHSTGKLYEARYS